MNKEELKQLNYYEIGLLDEMKSNCLNGEKYKDEKAKDKFYMLCHLEDFVIKYYDLQRENKQLKEVLHEIRNIDIFKEFTFPLMERWEEQQVLSSIDYQFKNTFIRKINALEKGDSNE